MGLIEQNLAADPSRRTLLRPSVVSIEADDAGVGITLADRSRRHRRGRGIDPAAQVRIHADSGRLLSVVAAPMRWGLPDPVLPRGAIADRRHRAWACRGSTAWFVIPSRSIRLTKLLNVHEGSR